MAFNDIHFSVLLVAVLLLVVHGIAAAEMLKENVRDSQLDNGMIFLVVERREENER